MTDVVRPAAVETAVAVLIPCYNEERTIASVVRQFRAQLPAADVYVFDNNSTDRSVQEAKDADAHVVHERRQGKGHVVQKMFRAVDADVYVMVDGDDTYPADAVGRLIAPILKGEADMVVGSRLHRQSQSQLRPLNRFGNGLFRTMLNTMFNVRLSDLLSGYRAFNAQVIDNLALSRGGFDTEIEMTVKVLEGGFTIVEVPVDLKPRPTGSHSKLRIVQDGLLVLRAMLTLLRDYRPLTFFGGLGVAAILLSFLPAGWVLADYLDSGLVHRIPSAVLAAALVILGGVLIGIGLVLHTISRRFQDLEFQLRAWMTDARRQRRSRRPPSA